MSLYDPNVPDLWHTHRGHDEACNMGIALKRAAGRITPPVPCTNECRHGEPWPTLRLLPADRKKLPHYIDPTAAKGLPS